MGPLGHEQMQESGWRLVQKAKIPLVFYKENATIICVIPSGSGTLLQKAVEVFGADHPFLGEVAQDMEALCHHRDAGEFIISGWRSTGKPLSFPIENGSHGGPGKNEPQGFAILPDTLDVLDQPFLRALDLLQHVRSIFRKD